LLMPAAMTRYDVLGCFIWFFAYCWWMGAADSPGLDPSKAFPRYAHIQSLFELRSSTKSPIFQIPTTDDIGRDLNCEESEFHGWHLEMRTYQGGRKMKAPCLFELILAG
jgi:hypothetical protein